MPRNATAKTIVPVFLAADDRYAPYCAVTLTSLVDTVSPKCELKIHILTDSLSAENRDKLRRCVAHHAIDFTDVREKAARLESRLALRDYYTKATYYRFFIPALFPAYDKALYLDSDLLVTGDVSVLFRTPLVGRLLAAVPEEVMTAPVFASYSERVLGVPSSEYVNAGVLVMNLRAMRTARLEEHFVRLLSEATYRVAQDQDYLNVLCYGKTLLLPARWNRSAAPSSCFDAHGILHFKLCFKPWRTDECLGAARFWQVAARTPYADALRAERERCTDADRQADHACFDGLVRLAADEAALIKENEKTVRRLPFFGAVREV